MSGELTWIGREGRRRRGRFAGLGWVGDSSGLKGSGFWLHGIAQGWMLERSDMVDRCGLDLLPDLESQMCRVGGSGEVLVWVR